MLAPETITALIAVAVSIVLAIIAILALDRLWPPLLRREFTVALPVEDAWRHLARVEQWPSWAKHIKRVELQPAGELRLGSTGRMLLTNGMKPAWTVTEFNLYRNWIWVGGFLWLTIYYDHRFEELNPMQTKITFALEASGFGKSIVGRLFAKIYSKTLDRAIASLVKEMNASRV
jgi:polyketide cyclase/dehydrase/lipid transport protein